MSISARRRVQYRGMNCDQQHDGGLTDERQADSDAAEGCSADGEFQLTPAGPELSAWDEAIQKKLDEDARHPPFVPVDMPEDTVRFSVRQALILTAFAAVMLVGLQFVRPDVFAGVLGVIAFLGLVSLSIIKPKADILYVCWWVVLMVYLIICVVAAVRR